MWNMKANAEKWAFFTLWNMWKVNWNAENCILSHCKIYERCVWRILVRMNDNSLVYSFPQCENMECERKRWKMIIFTMWKMWNVNANAEKLAIFTLWKMWNVNWNAEKRWFFTLWNMWNGVSEDDFRVYFTLLPPPVVPSDILAQKKI